MNRTVKGLYLSQDDFEQLAKNQKMEMAERLGVTLEEYEDALINGKVIIPKPKTKNPPTQQQRLFG